MQENRICTPAEEDAKNDLGILSSLFDADARHAWSVQELTRQLGDGLGAIDAIARLQAAGLLHRTADDFVFPTRAAAYFYSLAEA